MISAYCVDHTLLYITTHISGASRNIVVGKTLMKLVKKLEGWMAWFGESSISQTKNHPIFT